MRIVTLSNHKGGSAKTTTTVSLAAAFAEAGRRVLVVDLDPQESATYWLGGRESAVGLVEYSEGGIPVGRIVRRSTAPGVDLMPTSPSLVPSGEHRPNDTGHALVRGFARLPAYWDIVLVDTPPTIGHLSLAPLAASDHVVIPVETHALAMQGVARVVTSIGRARAQVNRRLDVLGILACRVTATAHTRDVIAQLREAFGSTVLTSTVRETVRLAEAPALHLPITLTAPNSEAAEDYRRVAAELVDRMEGAGRGP